MQLGVLVDRMIDAHQEALGLEIRQMLLQVEPRPGLRLPRHHVVHDQNLIMSERVRVVWVESVPALAK